MRADITSNEILHAHYLQARADFYTDVRDKAALVIGPVLLVYGPSVPLAVTTAAVEFTDYLDGRDARKASAILEEPTSIEGKAKDHLADKKFTYFFLAFSALRDIKKGNYKSAGFISAIAGVNVLRDREMAKIRSTGEKDNIAISAVPINRVKAAGLMMSLAVGTTPFIENKKGRIIRNTGLGISTVLGLIGLKEHKNKPTNEIKD